MSTQHKNVICVTACDRYGGYGIARALLHHKKHKNNKNYTVRALGRDANCMEELKKLGAEIKQIDYNNPGTIEQALAGCCWLIWIPESDNERVKQAKTFAEACKKAKVENLLFKSLLGADDADERSLREFREMEKCAEHCVDRHCILRCALFVQFLHLFAEQIVKHNKLCLPIRDDNRMSPIHLNDVFYSIYRILFDDNDQLNREMDRHHQKKHYTLTGPESISVNTFIDMMNIITDGNVKFEEVKRRECEHYLKQCEQKQTEPANKLEVHDEDREDKFPPPPCPNDIEIMTLCDLFDYIKCGKASYISGDVKKITEREPMPIIWFFKNHRDEFRPRK